MNNIRVSNNFMLREFQCKCGCQRVMLHSKLLANLQKLRATMGKPIIINSGYRCEVHNCNVGGVANSYHIKGMAADIRVTGVKPSKLADEARKAGFKSVILYDTFVHVDVR